MKDYHLGYVIFLALVAAGGGFLFGYDTAVISGTIGQVTQLYGLDVIQQGWYVGCALVGSSLGVAAAGTLSDRLGRKTAMIVAATMFTLSAVGCALCNTFDQLVIYRIIGGVGIGVASIVCPMYISEIAITRFRGRLVSTYQLAITIGFVAAYLANYLLLQWSHGVGEGSGLWHKVMVTEVYRGMLGCSSSSSSCCPRARDGSSCVGTATVPSTSLGASTPVRPMPTVRSTRWHRVLEARRRATCATSSVRAYASPSLPGCASPSWGSLWA